MVSPKVFIEPIPAPFKDIFLSNVIVPSAIDSLNAIGLGIGIILVEEYPVILNNLCRGSTGRIVMNVKYIQ
jgi:hypothetical protein